MDGNLSMNGVEAMIRNKYSNKDWAQYYVNSWTRNSLAQTIDVQSDTVRAAQDPTEPVMYIDPDTQEMHVVPVAKRLEFRKNNLAESLSILEAAKVLLSEDEETFSKRHLPEALITKQPEVAKEQENTPIAAEIAPVAVAEPVVKEKLADEVGTAPVEPVGAAGEATAAEEVPATPVAAPTI